MAYFDHDAHHELITALRLTLVCLQDPLLMSHDIRRTCVHGNFVLFEFLVLRSSVLLSSASNDYDITTATACFYNETSLCPCYPLRGKFRKPRPDHIKSELADEEEPEATGCSLHQVSICSCRQPKASYCVAIPEAQRLVMALEQADEGKILGGLRDYVVQHRHSIGKAYLLVRF